MNYREESTQSKESFTQYKEGSMVVNESSSNQAYLYFIMLDIERGYRKHIKNPIKIGSWWQQSVKSFLFKKNNSSSTNQKGAIE